MEILLIVFVILLFTPGIIGIFCGTLLFAGFLWHVVWNVAKDIFYRWKR